MPFVFKKTWR